MDSTSTLLDTIQPYSINLLSSIQLNSTLFDFDLLGLIDSIDGFDRWIRWMDSMDGFKADENKMEQSTLF